MPTYSASIPIPKSIKQANAAAANPDLSGRVRFQVGTSSSLDAEQAFDLITACDCIHDFAAPESTLADIRRLLRSDGTLFIIEPRVADRLEDNRNPIATMFYGFSIFHCMTQSLARGGPGLGTCLGPHRTEAWSGQRGFGGSSSWKSKVR